MKKHIALCLALSAVISLSACGGVSETAETSAEAVQEQTTAEENTTETEAVSEETKAETEEETETETEAVSAPKITNSSIFQNGSWLFKAGNGKYYMYNLAEKKCYQVSDDLPNPYGINDISGSLVYYYSDSSIYNAETGEKIFDASVDDNIIIYPAGSDFSRVFTSDLIFVGKKDTSFSGNGNYEIGCISNNGTWLKPMELSSNFYNNDRFNCYAIDSEYIYCTYANGKNQYIYDVNNDKQICIDNGTLRQFYRAEGSDYGYFFTTDFGLKNTISKTIVSKKHFLNKLQYTAGLLLEITEYM